VCVYVRVCLRVGMGGGGVVGDLDLVAAVARRAELLAQRCLVRCELVPLGTHLHPARSCHEAAGAGLGEMRVRSARGGGDICV